MEVTQIEYMKRKNLGNYEHEEIKFCAIVEDSEKPLEVVAELRQLAESALNPKTQNEAEVSKLETVAPPKEAEEVKEEKPKASKKAKAKKSSATPYNREDELHKTLFGKALDGIDSSWRKNKALKERAKEMSMELNGQDFLDENGLVLSSFEDLLKEKLDA